MHDMNNIKCARFLWWRPTWNCRRIICDM